jgi:uncharacterized membrane protein
MNSKKLIGLTIATAAALSFATAPAHAASAQGASGDVKCFGANACKGQSSCKTAKSSCKGMNACKGQGITMTSSEKACTDAGGKTTES